LAYNNTSTQLNGSRFSFPNISVSWDGVSAGNQAYSVPGGDFPRGAFKSISYDVMLDAGIVQGNQVAIVGRTMGYGTATGSVEMLVAEFDIWASQITLAGGGGPGGVGPNSAFPLMSIDFDLKISYSINDIDTRTDQLIGCRITKISTSNSSGNDATTASLDLSISRVIRNGVDMYGDPGQQ
jgi:hypothetical protein